MTALIRCVACGVGGCGRCVPAGITDGLVGGWRCTCRHTPEERGRAREQWQGKIAEMFRR